MKNALKLRHVGLKTIQTALLVCSLAISTSIAQVNAPVEKKFDFAVGINTDAFFGLYTNFQGSYGAPEKIAFTFYGIHWAGGAGRAWGNWTEFGAGVNLNAFKGLVINPQIGILSGNLLSSGAAGRAIFGDGIVPSITVNLLREKIEGQIYTGFYAPLRDKAPNGTTLAFLHYWGNLGYRVNSFFSLGVLYEQLVNTGGSNVEESTDVYQWVGPYVQFAKPGGGLFTRFSAGPDLVKGGDSFWKLTSGFSF